MVFEKCSEDNLRENSFSDRKSCFFMLFRKIRPGLGAPHHSLLIVFMRMSLLHAPRRKASQTPMQHIHRESAADISRGVRLHNQALALFV